jgi:ABC-type lipoprotein export system ATPase subunit
LEDEREGLPHTLSGGKAETSTSITWAMLNKPSLIITDDPIVSLDDKNYNRVIGLLEEQAASCQARLVVRQPDKRPLFEAIFTFRRNLTHLPSSI